MSKNSTRYWAKVCQDLECMDLSATLNPVQGIIFALELYKVLMYTCAEWELLELNCFAHWSYSLLLQARTHVPRNLAFGEPERVSSFLNLLDLSLVHNVNYHNLLKIVVDTPRSTGAGLFQVDTKLHRYFLQTEISVDPVLWWRK